MYAKSNYHDCHYFEYKNTHYEAAAILLMQYAPLGATVLDYGCGFGHFLRAVKSVGIRAVGVEFDAEAASLAQLSTGCDVLTVSDFFNQSGTPIFDVIHMGDVLEHLPEPAETLSKLLAFLKPGGLLFVEGPLELNPSPVYWAARLFGTLKHFLYPRFIGKGKPTHLFLTGQQQQLNFFHRVDPNLKQVYWEIYDTGWPYADSYKIKRFIAKLAIMVSGKKIGKTTFGNRFTGIFLYSVKL